MDTDRNGPSAMDNSGSDDCSTGVSQISSGSVMTTFILFAVLFTVLLISEISIMVRQIKTGPKH